MDRQTQLALLDRIHAHRADGRGTDTAAASYRHPVSTYTSEERLAAERALLERMPTIVGLSNLVPGPDTYAAITIGRVPVVVTRDRHGQVHAMLNVCRHRGAQIADGCGTAARLACPYHGWTYHSDGRLAARRRAAYFADIDATASSDPVAASDRGDGHAGGAGGDGDHDDLVRLPVREQHGLIWVSADPSGSIPEQPLQGAEADLAHLGLADHRQFTSATFTRPINWKLVIDTFLEVYHVGVLHKNTIDPLIHSDYALFDAFGHHGRMIVTRRSIAELDDLPRQEWPFFPHTTIVWALQPNAILIYQQDHAQLYQARPASHPGEAIITVSLHVPRDSARNDDHWQRNFDLLIEVTDTEDFVTCAGIQRGFVSAANTHITFGRNEPLLAHFERELTGLVSSSTPVSLAQLAGGAEIAKLRDPRPDSDLRFADADP